MADPSSGFWGLGSLLGGDEPSNNVASSGLLGGSRNTFPGGPVDVPKQLNGVARDLSEQVGILGKIGMASGKVLLGYLALKAATWAIKKTLNGMWTMTKNIGKALVWDIPINTITNSVKILYKVYKGLYNITYKTMQSLAEHGYSVREEFKTIMTSVESAKDIFDVAETTGRNIMKMGRSGLGLVNSFQSTNSKFAKLFGRGAEGVSKAISDTSSQIQNMGNLSEYFGEAVMENINTVYNFNMAAKGLGLSGEDIKYFAVMSRSNLESITKAFGNTIIAIRDVASDFGINRKILSKNFMTLRRDIVEFGHIGDTELAKVASRAIHLGIEMSELSNMFKKVNTFESASTMASQLSQAFGMNIDALQLLKAEDPMQMIDMLRESMMATGKTFDGMSRFEKQLITQYTGLSAEAAKLTFNYRDLGKSHEEIKQIMKDNRPEEKQLKAIQNMTSSVTQLIHILNEKSPIEAFFGGLTDRIKRTIPGVMSISKTLEGFKNLAYSLDKKDVEKITAPFKGIIGPIDKALLRLKSKMPAIVKDISGFMENITKDWNSPDAYKNAQKNLDNFIGNSGKASSRFLADFQKIGLNIVGIVVKAAMTVVPTILRTFRKILVGIREMFSTTPKEPSEYFRKFLKSMGLTIGNFRDFWNDVRGELLGDGTGNDSIFSLIKSALLSVADFLYDAVYPTFKRLGGDFVDVILDAIATKMPQVAELLGLGNRVGRAAIGDGVLSEAQNNSLLMTTNLTNGVLGGSESALTGAVKKQFKKKYGDNWDTSLALTDKIHAYRQMISKIIEMQIKQIAGSSMSKFEKKGLTNVLLKAAESFSGMDLNDDKAQEIVKKLESFAVSWKKTEFYDKTLKAAAKESNTTLSSMTDEQLTNIVRLSSQSKELLGSVGIAEKNSSYNQRQEQALRDRYKLDVRSRKRNLTYDFTTDAFKKSAENIENALKKVFTDMKMSGTIVIDASGEMAIKIVEAATDPKNLNKTPVRMQGATQNTGSGATSKDTP
jgi:hypothetical protein